MTISLTQQIGFWAEQKACEFLENKGYILTERNFKSRFGEIDLIMEDQDCIVFVEVRYRSNNIAFGSAEESVDGNKMSRLIKTAICFLQAKRWLYKKVSRFDIIAIHGTLEDMQLEWFKNAFTVDG